MYANTDQNIATISQSEDFDRQFSTQVHDSEAKETETKRKKFIIASVVGVAIVILVVVTVTVLVVGSSEPDDDEEIIIACEQASAFGLIDAQGFQAWVGEVKQVEYQRNLVTCPGLVEDSQLSLTLPGVYFHSFTVGISGNRRVHFAVIDGQNSTFGSIMRNSTRHQQSETMSRSILMTVNQSDTVLAVAKGNIFDRSTYLMTSWCGWRLDGVFDLQEAFTIERTTVLHALGPVSYDTKVTSVGSGLNPDGSSFTAPSPGMYLFSLSLGIDANPDNSTQVSLRVNSVTHLLLHRSVMELDGIDTASQTALLQLDAGDVVDVNLESGHLEGSPDNTLTSFTGFLYKPLHNTPVAWFVYRTEPWQASPGPSFDPVTFDSTYLNEGGAYNTTTHQAVLPFTGVYYIHVSVGVTSMLKMWLQIRHNGVNIGSVAQMPDSQPGDNMISRGVLFEGEEGDTVHLWADACPTCALFSTQTGKQTSFMGILVSPMVKDIQ